LLQKDKIYCVYIAADEDSVWEHAKKSGFPADKVEEVKAILDPTVAGVVTIIYALRFAFSH